MDYVAAKVPRVVQVAVAFPFVAGVDGEFCTAAYHVERTAYIMGYGEDDFLAHFKQRPVLPYAFLKFFLVPVSSLHIAVYYDKRNEQHQ